MHRDGFEIEVGLGSIEIAALGGPRAGALPPPAVSGIPTAARGRQKRLERVL